MVEVYHRLCPLCNQLLHRKHWDSAACPLCGHANEKASHVLLCPDAGALRESSRIYRQVLPAALAAAKTDPSLSDTLCSLLFSCRRSRRVTANRYPSKFRRAMLSQARIGWTNFLLGRWSTEWIRLQDRYLHSIGSRRSPHRWLATVLRHLVEAHWKAWEYRTSRFRGADGSALAQEHREVDTLIRAEFEAGFVGLGAAAQPHAGLRLEVVLALPLDEKRAWLSTIAAGRKRFSTALPGRDPDAGSCELLRAWLTSRAHPP